MSRLVAAAAAAMVAGLALAGCSSDAPRNSAGQVTAAASVDAFQVTLGDCTGPMKEGNIMSLQVLPCDDAHYFEAYARTELPDGDYPGEDAAQERPTPSARPSSRPSSGSPPRTRRWTGSTCTRSKSRGRRATAKCCASPASTRAASRVR
ncbi:MAG: hypothetical protein R2742_08285 [Micropruina glycogenica]